MNIFIRISLLVFAAIGADGALAASGDLDTTFGPVLNGYATYAFDLGGNKADTSQVVLTQANGNIVLVGRAIDSATSGRIALVRLQPTGVVDSTFGSGGSATFSLVSGSYTAAIPYVNAAALDTQGRILVAGDTANDQCSYVARFTANGVIDGSFATGGVYVACPSSGHYIRFMDVAVDSSDRPVLAGTYATLSGDFVASSQYLALRLTAAGQSDPTFNGGAIYTQSIGLVVGGKDHAGAVMLDRAGRIYLGGGAQTASNDDAEVVLRLTAAGAPDTTCTSSGWVDLGATADSGFVATSVVQRDAHHVVLVGTWYAQSGPAQNGIAYADMDADTCAAGVSGITVPATTATAGRAIAASDGAVYISYSQLTSNVAGAPWYAGILALYDALPWNDSFTGIYSNQSTYGTGITLVGGKPLQAMLAQYSGEDYDFAVARFQNDRIFYANFERDGAKSTP
ncbi:hypothetical protein [Dokdonella soli]|uniref:Delta-60 repeat domain-containing protein n=1 Tax=Dokdonella soli TaxID=529810 RepID=A0ABN1IT11_9GAMM